MGLGVAFSIAAAFAVLYKKKIEETIACSILFITTVLFVFNVFRIIDIGIYVIYVMGGISLVIVFLSVIKDKSSLKSIFTFGLIGVLVYIIAIGLFCRGRDIKDADDYYCWGYMIKKLLYQGYVANTETITAGHTPFVPIWNYYFAKTFEFMFEFTDGICLWAQGVLSVSMYIPLFTFVKKKSNILNFVFISIVTPFIVKTWGQHAYSSLMTDSLIGGAMCLCIYSLCMFLKNKGDKFYYILMLFSLVSITLTKRMGVVFAGLMMAVILYSLHKFKYDCKIVLLLSVSLSGLLLLWSMFTNYIFIIPLIIFPLFFLKKYILGVKFEPVTNKQYSLIILFVGIIMILTMFIPSMMDVLEYPYNVIFESIRKCFGLGGSTGYLVVSYVYYIVAALSIYVYINNKKQESDSNICELENIYNTILFAISIVMIIYIVFDFVVHIKYVAPANGYNTTLILRYIAPWIIMLTFIFFMMINEFVKNIAKYYVMVLILITTLDIRTVVYESTDKWNSNEYYEFSQNNITLTSDDYIYFVDENPSYPLSDREFFYYMQPATTNFVDNPLGGTNEKLTLSISEWKQILEKYNYVYIQSYMTDFTDRYADLFEDKDDIDTGSAYYVIKDSDNDIVLRKIK